MIINHFKLEVRPYLIKDKHWEFRCQIVVDGEINTTVRIVSLKEFDMVESIYDYLFGSAKRELLKVIKEKKSHKEREKI